MLLEKIALREELREECLNKNVTLSDREKIINFLVLK